MPFKIKKFKIYTFKKINDVIGYDKLQAYKQAFKIHIPTLLVFFRESNKNYIF